MESQRIPERKLGHKRELFVSAYLGQAKGNATEAARVAGYKQPEQEGHRLLKNAEVRARVDAFLAEAAMTSREVLAELSDIAKAPWKHFVTVLDWDDEGNPLRVKMDLNAKVKSLELLGKHHRLFDDHVNLDATFRREYTIVDPPAAPTDGEAGA